VNFSYEIYDLLEGLSPYLILWVFLFTIINAVRIAISKSRGLEKIQHSSIFAELPAIPLVLLQSVCFVKAVLAADVLSALLFLWWGPGFFITVLYVIYCHKRNTQPNWYPMRFVISWLCKLNYLMFMIVFFILDKPGMMFLYSVWVINDQYGLAYLSLDADRLRRTFHDYWVVRILYPLGLFIPFFYPSLQYRFLYLGYGTGLFLLWLSGIYYVHKKLSIMTLPIDPTLWRNMVYFARTSSTDN